MVIVGRVASDFLETPIALEDLKKSKNQKNQKKKPHTICAKTTKTLQRTVSWAAISVIRCPLSCSMQWLSNEIFGWKMSQPKSKKTPKNKQLTNTCSRTSTRRRTMNKDERKRKKL